MVSREKGQRVRQRIIEAANRLFYERGYNRTSFSDIADVAGLIVDLKRPVYEAVVAEFHRFSSESGG